ncbi:hypothetical protein KIH31_17540 [Paenarthrobacter sp. DKR-5]|uniref:hypothetical protein n=1 Tax=Paenarthrobacter sp. DKR-5 TaxID=2835535 RepID=UPI001BDC08F4|nr:hypothetical protein [Paenarthrobacter sp. DKR-5]MBT1004391.1 hypothetical protein [Paenarthrobacter sp. DKR-5]
MKPLLPLAACAVLLLSGCSTAASHASGPPAASLPASTASPQATAAVDEFAAVIADNEDSWRRFQASVEQCSQAAEGVSPDDFSRSTECIRDARSIARSAQGATAKLRALAPPPPAIGPLVAQTIAALGPWRNSPVLSACQDKGSGICYEAVENIQESSAALVSLLSRWDRYTQPSDTQP